MPTGYLKNRLGEVDDFVQSIGFVYVNALGEVLNNRSQTKYETKLVGGKVCVELEKDYGVTKLVDGYYTSVADLVALAFKPTFVRIDQHAALEAVTVDGNPYNLHPENLVWLFPTSGLEHKSYPGFYYVPGHTTYIINKEGELLHAPSCRFKERVPMAGSLSVSVATDGGANNPACGLYRLLALTFLPYPPNVQSLSVNHKDGNRMNPDLNNLEWVTTSQNVRHGLIRKALGGIPEARLYMGDEKPSEVIERLSQIKAICCLDVVTKEVTVFEKRADVMTKLGILDNQLWQSLNAAAKVDGIGMVKDRYIFRYFGQPFPEVTPDLIVRHRSQGGQPRPVLVKDGETKDVKEYVSAASVVKELNLSKKVVTTRLSRGDQVIPGTNLRVSYKDSFQQWTE